MPSSEFESWKAYYKDEPFGAPLFDYGQALIRHMIASVNRDPEKTPNPYALKDFLTFTKEPEKKVQPIKSPIKGLSMSSFLLLKSLEARNKAMEKR